MNIRHLYHEKQVIKKFSSFYGLENGSPFLGYSEQKHAYTHMRNTHIYNLHAHPKVNVLVQTGWGGVDALDTRVKQGQQNAILLSPLTSLQ